MHQLRAADPADTVVAWEAVEELLQVVPEGIGKDVLRMIAAGMTIDDIATSVGMPVDDVRAVAARARVRVLTAAIDSAGGGDQPADGRDGGTPRSRGDQR